MSEEGDGLVATGEIAELYGVSKQRADQITRRPDFPPPAEEVATGGGRTIRTWRRSDAVEYGRKTGRLTS